MNRIGREPLIGGRNVPAPSRLLLNRRDRGLAGGHGTAGEEDASLELELFSKTRGGGSSGVSSLLGSDGRAEPPGKVVGLAKTGRSSIDELLDVDMGKHDYDWLLTPPGTPQFSPSNATENPLPVSVHNHSSSVRSVSNTRTSRLSTSQTEIGQSVRPARSSSVTRASVSSHITNNNRTSVLSTSSASVTSVTSRSVTPGRRPATPSSAQVSMKVTNPVATRSSTPIKSRTSVSSSGLKTTTPQNSRPATPTKRPTVSSSSSSLISSSVRASSRPSTPTRQPITRATTPGPPIGRSPSVGRLSTSNIRAPQSAPSSRPSSPSPRPRTPVRPIDIPDFPSDTPPNLRTKLPEHPVSAGRSRSGMTLSVRSNSNTEAAPPSLNRRISLPIVARSKFPENSPKASHNNGKRSTPPENQRPVLPDAGIRRLSKTTSATDSTGFGRTISKKSMDMALRHMDIRQSMGAIRGVSLFPQSIRSAPPKVRSTRVAAPVISIDNDNNFAENDNCNETISGESNGSLSGIHSITRLVERENTFTESSNGIDPYSSYRYDMLLKEDFKDTNWLHTVDDKSDQSSLFDHRFEPLPEPFGHL